jgi:hypothetical protein
MHQLIILSVIKIILTQEMRVLNRIINEILAYMWSEWHRISVIPRNWHMHTELPLGETTSYAYKY